MEKESKITAEEFMNEQDPGDVDMAIRTKLDDINVKIRYHEFWFRRYKTLHKLYTIPLVVFQAVLSSAIIINTTQIDPQKSVLIFTAVLSSLIFVASSLGRFLDWENKSHQYDLCSKIYRRLRDATQLRLLKNHLSKVEKLDIYYDLITNTDTIAVFEID